MMMGSLRSDSGAQVSIEVLMLLATILALAAVATYLAKTLIYGTTTSLNQTLNITGEKLK